MSVNKKSVPKKVAASKATAEQPISNNVSNEKLHAKLDEFASKWSGFNQLKAWESKTSIKYDVWKKKIMDLANQVFDKYLITSKEIFKKSGKKHPEEWEDGDFHNFLDEAERRIYTKDYVPIAKPSGFFESSEYYVYVIDFSGYNDWGESKFQEQMKKIKDYTKEEMAENLNKTYKVVKTNGKESIKPLKYWEKGDNKSELPMHSYMGEALIVAMPVKSYEAAIKYEQKKAEDLKIKISELKEQDRSPLWNELKPGVLSCSGDFFGLQGNPLYTPLKEGTYYRMMLNTDRGKKIKKDNKEWFLFEGIKTINIELAADGSKIEIPKYSGVRSFQYNFKLSEQLDKDKKSTTKIISQKEFDISPEDLINTAYDAWILENGLAGVPAFFNKYKYKQQEGKERLSCLSPVAFEADVLEGKITKLDDQTQLKSPKISVRVDDRLDGKNVKFNDKDFAELTLYGLNNLTEDFIKHFEKCIKPQSRVKVIATISQSSATSSLSGQLYYIELVNSGNDEEDNFDSSMWDIEDSSEQNIAIEQDSEPKEESKSEFESSEESEQVEIAENKVEEETDDSLALPEDEESNNK